MSLTGHGKCQEQDLNKDFSSVGEDYDEFVEDKRKKYEFSKKKPLFLQMQDNYNMNVLMPILAQKKSELAKKRLMFRPIDHTEIIEHQKKHSELKKLRAERRMKKMMQNKLNFKVNSVDFNYNSVWAASLEDEMRRLREENEKKNREKFDLIQKKVNYSKIVKHIYLPEPRLNKEFKGLGKEKSQSVKNMKNFKGLENFSMKNFNELEFKPKKFKKNKMVPENKAQKTVVVKDYLAEIRKAREENRNFKELNSIDWKNDLTEGDFTRKFMKVKSKVELYDHEAYKHENLLNNFNASSKQALKKSEKFDELILTSIKAKLALYEKYLEN